jgi:hypothetical protein
MLHGMGPKGLALSAFELILFVLYARLRLTNAAAIRMPRAEFGDTADYLFIAAQSLFSARFWLSDKPFLIPLFFKVLGANFNLIFAVHVYFSILCWAVLAVVCALVIRSYPLKFAAFAVVLGFSLSQQIILWDPIILSESMHYSLWALFYACGLLLCRRWTGLKAGILIGLGALLAFARDTNAYMLLGAGILLMLLALLRYGGRRLLIVGGAFVLIFAVSFAFSSAGGHPFPALMNLVGLRILPDPDYLVYFQKQGMPVSEALLQYTGKAAHWDDLAMTQDPALVQFRSWLRQHGTSVFVRFLWHFKADTLQKPLGDPVAVLTPNLYYYSATGFKPILENTRFSEWLYPMRFGIVVFGAASVLAAFMAGLGMQSRKTLWLMPILMILLAYPQIVFIWNTDPNDIFRHALPLNVQWRLGLWLLALLAADAALDEAGPRAAEWAKAFGQRVRPGNEALGGKPTAG